MLQIKFKNLERSELIENAVRIRFQTQIEKFPRLSQSRIQVLLEMENSPTQAGPDVFKVRFQVASGYFKGMIIQKSNGNLYVALAEVVEHLLELLNRSSDKARVKERQAARRLERKVKESTLSENFG